MSGIGTVSESLISAMRAVLSEKDADGAFVAAAISLPAVDELIDVIQNADPLLLHAVRVLPPVALHHADCALPALPLDPASPHLCSNPRSSASQVAQVRVHISKELARALQPELEAVVAANEDPPGEAYSPEAPAAARRAAKNKALSYLSMLGDATIMASLLRRFQTAQNMTDQIAVLAALNETPGPLS